MEIELFVQRFVDLLEETDVEGVTGKTIFRTLDEWDSLTALSLIAMVDEEYSVKLTGADIRNAATIADIFEIIKARS